MQLPSSVSMFVVRRDLLAWTNSQGAGSAGSGSGSAGSGASAGEGASVCERQEKQRSPVRSKQIVSDSKDRRCLLVFTVVSSSFQVAFHIGYNNV